MPGNINQRLKPRASEGNLRHKDPRGEPDPPEAPPVIIFFKDGEAEHHPENDPKPDNPPPAPPIIILNKDLDSNRRTRSHDSKVPDPSPDPEPEPNPAPPVIIFPKRPASSSPPYSKTDSKTQKSSSRRPVTRSISKPAKEVTKESLSSASTHAKSTRRNKKGHGGTTRGANLEDF
ncbi:hypothetical protein BCR34DRAFT_647465 [Clohesyomyces aquaticus]|uniref:Uncharacterized protein n=1 Tax=Clohesyomyces aquaticus TaxID=1231657 RepID=A0A1Y1ZUF7_9PLEO|nr:hypothetical protein BCR34DRAFT_647465 [Clohesyomyces aquaticus]